MVSDQLPPPARLQSREKTFAGDEHILNEVISPRAFSLFGNTSQRLAPKTTHLGQESFAKEFNKIKELIGCNVNEQLETVGEANIECTPYVRMAKLGRGSYSSVDLCIDARTRKRFIIKTMKKDKFRSNEVIVPLCLSHPNITKVFGLLPKYDENVELMIEYGGESLYNYLKDNTLTEEQIWNLSEQGLDGLAHMDDNSVMHLDIKSENICIQLTGTNDLWLKFTDFGSAMLQQESVTFKGLASAYMAPELCQLYLHYKAGISLTGKVDVFTFQLVIQYMYRKKHVLLNLITRCQSSYKGILEKEQKELRQNIIVLLATNRDLMQLVMIDECDLDMKELLTKMGAFSPDDRLSAKEALALIKARNERTANAEKLQNNRATLPHQPSGSRDIWDPVAIVNTNLPLTAQIQINDGQRPLSKVKEQLRNKIKLKGEPWKAQTELVANAEKLQNNRLTLPHQNFTANQPSGSRDNWYQVAIGNANVPPIAQIKMNEGQQPPSKVKVQLRNKIKSRHPLGMKEQDGNTRGKGKAMASMRMCPPTPMEELKQLSLACLQTNMETSSSASYQESVLPTASPVVTPCDRFHDLDRYPIFDRSDTTEVCNKVGEVDTAVMGNVPNLDMLWADPTTTTTLDEFVIDFI